MGKSVSKFKNIIIKNKIEKRSRDVGSLVVFAGGAQSLGFKPDHHINRIWQLTPVISAPGGEDRRLKALLGYRMNLRPSWTSGGPASKKNVLSYKRKNF